MNPSKLRISGCLVHIVKHVLVVWEEVAHGNGSISIYHSNQTIKDVWLNLLVSVLGLPNVNQVKELNC